MSRFETPDELSSHLRHVEPESTKTDEQITDSLCQFQPVVPEKNIWAFWYSGVRSMPPWTLRSVISWVRMHDADWTVRVLDSDPTSPNYCLNYVPASYLPDVLVHGTLDGPYVGPHSADFLQGACLFLHGGAFLDLADPSSPFQISVPWMYGTTTSNAFTAAWKGDSFVESWHKLFVHVWQGRVSHEGIIDNPLLAFAADITFDEARAAKFHWDFTVEPRVVMEYIGQIMCWRRLCMLYKDQGGSFVPLLHWKYKILIFDVLEECWGAEATLGFPGCGQKMFDLLKLPLNFDQASGQYQEARKLVWRLLSESSMQKVIHGKHLTHHRNIDELWDDLASDGSNCEPGTFAKLLRYGAEHFEQVREEIRYIEAPQPTLTLAKDLYEA